MTRRTEATNTLSTYGWVERGFHWAIALLIATALVLGRLAYDAPFDTDAALARKAWLFSFHKTVGVAIFFVALARILWALSQPRPRPLHGGAEAMLAALVHWLLYGSLVIVPLLGWAHHATAEGFAPIWWPFGQGLPGLGPDAVLSKVLGVLHTTFVKVLVGALVLHIVGTLKHVILDRDLTFARMWKGADPGPLSAARSHLLPLVGAVAVWLATLGVGLALVPSREAAATGTAEVAGVSNWTVEEGTLSITVTQLGTPVTGSFADWQAAIDFDPEPRADDTNGTVEVSVATGSLTLGSVTDQATGAEFLAAGEHPTATYVAELRPEGDAYVADGTLTLRGVEVPLTLPFTLDLTDGRAEMTATAGLDRRDFGMGETAYPDESSVGFGVTMDVALTAVRAE
ncbi:cytochrome b/b6 domain-containing protein [Jannaschia marina]|uniref:cytochrome b/b6 domain-containing protein n=1 Tax=Jannaschia marina TaxID=2741674 RepID=UPI0015CC88D6|nr:cytochrome b/b6 domain-containing protein [Jannaschia marina]